MDSINPQVWQAAVILFVMGWGLLCLPNVKY